MLHIFAFIAMLSSCVAAQEYVTAVQITESGSHDAKFSADGAYYLAVEEAPRSLKAFSLPDGSLAKEFQCEGTAVVGAFDLSPDGKTLAMGCGDRLRILSFPGGQELRSVKVKKSERRPAAVERVQFTREGRALVYNSPVKLAVLEAPKWKAAWDEDFMGGFDVAPDGSAVTGVEGDDEGFVTRSARRLDDGKVLWTWSGKSYKIKPPCFGLAGYSSDGRALVYDANGDTLCATDPVSGKLAKTAPLALDGLLYAHAPGGRVLAYGKDSALKLWALPEMTVEMNISVPFTVGAVAASPKGKLLFAAGNNGGRLEIAVIRVPGAKVVRTLEHKGYRQFDRFYLSVSPDGRYLSVRSQKGPHTIWSLEPAGAAGQIAALSSQLEAERGGASVLKKRALAYYASNDVEKAISDFAEAARLAPNDADAAATLGDLHLEVSRYKEAATFYTNAMRGGPSAKLLVGRGVARAYVRDFDGAAEDFSAAMKLDPKDAKIPHLRGIVRHNQGRIDEALADQQAALKIDPAMAQAHFYSGLALQAKRDRLGALDAYGAALKHAPADVQTRYYRGRLRLERGDAKGALEDLQEAASVSQTADIYFALGAAQKQLGKDEDAASSFGFASDRGHPIAPFLVGLEAMRRGYPDSARDSFKKAVERNPGNSEFQEHLEAAEKAHDSNERAAVGKILAEGARANPAANLGLSLVDAALGIAAGVNRSGGSSGGYVAGSGGSSGPGASAIPDNAAAWGRIHERTLEGQSRDLDRANRQAIEKKFWDMNNPRR